MVVQSNKTLEELKIDLEAAKSQVELERGRALIEAPIIISAKMGLPKSALTADILKQVASTDPRVQEAQAKVIELKRAIESIVVPKESGDQLTPLELMIAALESLPQSAMSLWQLQKSPSEAFMDIESSVKEMRHELNGVVDDAIEVDNTPDPTERGAWVEQVLPYATKVALTASQHTALVKELALICTTRDSIKATQYLLDALKDLKRDAELVVDLCKQKGYQERSL